MASGNAMAAHTINLDIGDTVMKQMDLKIAIVGAGVGGLTLALALRERGIDAQLYEQTDELREVGAAVALSANATRFYERMGLRADFEKVCAEVPGLVYRDGRSGAVIGHRSSSWHAQLSRAVRRLVLGHSSC
jgi:2-polyprenyl-6-methoxyphenol hydroxylase-like FAD-dependent oxidoreductase